MICRGLKLGQSRMQIDKEGRIQEKEKRKEI